MVIVFCYKVQEDYNCDFLVKGFFWRGGVLYSVFCQVDQTVRRGRIVLFLKFFMPPGMFRDLLLRRESSIDPIAEYHQIRTGWLS